MSRSCPAAIDTKAVTNETTLPFDANQAISDLFRNIIICPNLLARNGRCADAARMLATIFTYPAGNAGSISYTCVPSGISGGTSIFARHSDLHHIGLQPAADDCNQRHDDHDGGGRVAETRIKRRANRPRQRRVEHAFGPKRQRIDDAPEWIDHS